MLVRPVTHQDHSALLRLAREAGYGFTSLPQDEEVLAKKIKRSELSFAGKEQHKGERQFLFVMEEPETGEIIGSTGIKSHVGVVSPFYSYKLSKIVQANSALDIYTLNEVLHMVNDYTGASEIGSLFLRKAYRRGGVGRFLSRCRFLMLAEFPHLFDDIVIAEMRGVHDEEGNSPFYDNLARHFFHMPFTKADYINATQGGQFIADLMPKYPIYTALLAEEARQVIGVVNEASRPALRMLEREGFAYSGYVDIFDAGPTVKVMRDHIRTSQNSRKVTVQEIADIAEDAEARMCCNGLLADYRLISARLAHRGDDAVILSKQDAEMLKVKAGEKIRIVA
jgi:arginine N-succinyltransferase